MQGCCVSQDKPSDIDLKRRQLLGKATATVGLAGVACATIPFMSSMLPSAAALASGAPVKVDLSELKPGEQRTVEWRRKPIWIIRRTPEILAELAQMHATLRDPNSDVEQQPGYAANLWRSLKPEFLVLIGICTHLGCAPTYRPDKEGVEAHWPGGFFCSCHGSKFDLSGRVYKGVPAPINLEVPPYTYVSEYEILIGVDPTPEQLQAIAADNNAQEWFA